MAKTATAPTAPYFPAKPAREPRRERTASIEERTAVLETRWEETVPTLATSKDISDLRSELIKWGVGAVLALAAVFFGMLATNTARIDRLDSKIDARMDAAIAEIKADNRATNARIDKLDAKLDSRIDKLDAKFDVMMAELRSQRSTQ